MGRSYKIKRYKRIYRRSISSIVLQWLLILGGVGLLFLLGWKLYEPVVAFFGGEHQIESKQEAEEKEPPAEEKSEEIPQIPAETPPTEQVVVETPAVSMPAEAPKAEEKAPELPQITTPAERTLYLSMETVLDGEAFEATLSAAKAEGMDSVMFDLKSREGWVNYPISYKEGYDDYYTARNTVSLKETADKIRSAGLKPIASIYAFLDRRYQQAETYAGILYQGTDSFWLDNAPDAGGKSWLNPYSPLARDYLKKLMSDAAEAGFGEIVLREFRFPVGAAMDKMRFVYDAGQSKIDCLKEVDDEFRRYAEELGLALWIEYPAAAFGGDERPYGGAAAQLLEDGCIIDLSDCGSDSMELADIIATIVHEAKGAELAGMTANTAQREALQAAGIDHYISIK